MREILFRVWDKKYQLYCRHDWQPKLGTMAYFSGDGYSSLSWCIENMDDFEVEQFTGLTDKNNVKLFEGDIIEQWGETITIENLEDVFGMLQNCTIFDGDFEIVGNIHD